MNMMAYRKFPSSLIGGFEACKIRIFKNEVDWSVKFKNKVDRSVKKERVGLLTRFNGELDQKDVDNRRPFSITNFNLPDISFGWFLAHS
jgi:hypothetical protein